jgi:transposase
VRKSIYDDQRGTGTKKINLFTGTAIFVESVTTALGLLSEFREMKTKRGRASEKCRKKAGRYPNFRLGRLAPKESGTHHNIAHHVFNNIIKRFNIIVILSGAFVTECLRD